MHNHFQSDYEQIAFRTHCLYGIQARKRGLSPQSLFDGVGYAVSDYVIEGTPDGLGEKILSLCPADIGEGTTVSVLPDTDYVFSCLSVSGEAVSLCEQNADGLKTALVGSVQADLPLRFHTGEDTCALCPVGGDLTGCSLSLSDFPAGSYRITVRIEDEEGSETEVLLCVPSPLCDKDGVRDRAVFSSGEATYYSRAGILLDPPVTGSAYLPPLPGVKGDGLYTVDGGGYITLSFRSRQAETRCQIHRVALHADILTPETANVGQTVPVNAKAHKYHRLLSAARDGVPCAFGSTFSLEGDTTLTVVAEEKSAEGESKDSYMVILPPLATDGISSVTMYGSSSLIGTPSFSTLCEFSLVSYLNHDTFLSSVSPGTYTISGTYTGPTPVTVTCGDQTYSLTEEGYFSKTFVTTKSGVGHITLRSDDGQVEQLRVIRSSAAKYPSRGDDTPLYFLAYVDDELHTEVALPYEMTLNGEPFPLVLRSIGSYTDTMTIDVRNQTVTLARNIGYLDPDEQTLSFSSEGEPGSERWLIAAPNKHTSAGQIDTIGSPAYEVRSTRFPKRLSSGTLGIYGAADAPYLIVDGASEIFPTLSAFADFCTTAKARFYYVYASPVSYDLTDTDVGRTLLSAVPVSSVGEIISLEGEEGEISAKYIYVEE